MNGKLLYYYKHTLIMMKNHAGPNNKGLPLKRISRTLFRKKDYTTKP